MTHLDGMANAELALNPQNVGDWPWHIGEFMLNFATIEWISHQYLSALEPTRQDFERSVQLFLGKRITRIQELVLNSQAIVESDKNELVSFWDEVRAGSRWRNRIAHNPVLWSWEKGKDPAQDPPSAIGITDMQQIEQKDTTDNLSVEAIRKLIEASVDVAARLHAGLGKVQGTSSK